MLGSFPIPLILFRFLLPRKHTSHFRGVGKSKNSTWTPTLAFSPFSVFTNTSSPWAVIAEVRGALNMERSILHSLTQKLCKVSPLGVPNLDQSPQVWAGSCMYFQAKRMANAEARKKSECRSSGVIRQTLPVLPTTCRSFCTWLSPW